jgi:hypothetical protein
MISRRPIKKGTRLMRGRVHLSSDQFAAQVETHLLAQDLRRLANTAHAIDAAQVGVPLKEDHDALLDRFEICVPMGRSR